jgi:hypothetical protein
MPYDEDVYETVPNPGSDEAIKEGCTCPVIDNHHGRGFMYGGELSFWYNYGCPVHCPHKPEEKRDD